MQAEELKEVVVQALEDLKAVDVRVLDVRNKTSITDLMVIASGTSDRHVRALASNVIDVAKQHGVRALGTEGEELGEWILVDLVDVVVHVMLPQIRDFYNLEKLWEFEEVPSASASRSS
jgi:ribosome-associated protein